MQNEGGGLGCLRILWFLSDSSLLPSFNDGELDYMKKNKIQTGVLWLIFAAPCGHQGNCSFWPKTNVKSVFKALKQQNFVQRAVTFTGTFYQGSLLNGHSWLTCQKHAHLLFQVTFHNNYRVQFPSVRNLKTLKSLHLVLPHRWIFFSFPGHTRCRSSERKHDWTQILDHSCLVVSIGLLSYSLAAAEATFQPCYFFLDPARSRVS